MSDGITLTFPGLDELLRELRQLPQNLQQRVMKGAVATGASVIRLEAIRLAPDWAEDGPVKPLPPGHPPPGTLKKAIYQTRLPSECTPTREVWKVDVRQGKRAQATKRGGRTVNLDAYYATWVEYGHFVRVPFEMTKSAKAAGRALDVAKYVPAHPFMRPAVATKSQAALDAMQAYIAKNLPLAVAGMRYLQPT